MKTLIELSRTILKDGLLHTEDGDTIELSRHKKDKDGNPLPVNGCTYNFNRDIDTRCFRNALARFVRTGAKEDAFDVFFCYAEIFRPFGGYKQGIDSLLQLLYDHEANSASLLTKHRDHYSHSVYVFALGLALYNGNKKLREAFAARYGSEHAEKTFLHYWGMTALFHDIGYPYEISFLQVLEYGKKTEKSLGRRLRMRYHNLGGFTALTPAERKRCGGLLPKGGKDINDLLVAAFLDTFDSVTGDGKQDNAFLKSLIEERIEEAEEYMDHAYFSAVLLLKRLLAQKDFMLDRPTLDAVLAIFLHNSFYKISYKGKVKNIKPYEQIHLSDSPLAYLLMFCDELQCWDRVPYGENSKKQELAWDMDLSVSDDKITALYYFETGKDKKSVGKIDTLAADIKKKVIDWSEMAEFSASHEIKVKDKKVYDYFSDSKFIDLCRIAEAINSSYMQNCRRAGITDYMKNAFDSLTLEYKLSNIAQAKYYVRHLENINCFFSDRQLDYPVVKAFTEEEVAKLAVDEHIRWVNEKVEMGWKYGTGYKRAEREPLRIHKDIVPYEELVSAERSKDTAPINNMITLLGAYGIRIYRMNTQKEELVLGCTGHIDLNRIDGFDEEQVRGEIRSYLRRLQERYSLTLLSGFAQGADLLFAEEALKCGVSVIAVLPCIWDEFRREHSDGGERFMQLLGQVKEVVIKPHVLTRYYNVSRYIVKHCDELLVLWDGKVLPLQDENGNDIHIGGTYDTMTAAVAAGKNVKLF